MNTQTLAPTRRSRWERSRKEPSSIANILPWIIGLICVVADVIALIAIASRSS